MTFARRPMAPSSRHARSVDPNLGSESNQLSRRGEDRVKQPAARIRKIVVGINGKSAPMNPSSTNNRPSASHKDRETRPARSGVSSGKGRMDELLKTGKCGLRSGYHALILLGRQAKRVEDRDKLAPMLRSPIGMPGQVPCAKIGIETQ